MSNQAIITHQPTEDSKILISHPDPQTTDNLDRWLVMAQPHLDKFPKDIDRKVELKLKSAIMMLARSDALSLQQDWTTPGCAARPTWYKYVMSHPVLNEIKAAIAEEIAADMDRIANRAVAEALYILQQHAPKAAKRLTELAESRNEWLALQASVHVLDWAKKFQESLPRGAGTNSQLPNIQQVLVQVYGQDKDSDPPEIIDVAD